MKEKIRTKIESLLQVLEVSKEQNQFDASVLEQTVNSIKNLRSLAEYTPEEEKELLARLVSLGYVPTFKTEAGVMDKAAVVKKSIFTGAKVKVAAAVTGVAVMTASLYACSKVDFANVTVTQSVTPSEANGEENEEETVNVKDPWNLELCKDITKGLNNELENGLPRDMQITKESKNEVESYVLWYLMNKMDDLTDEQWANIFQNSTITSEDFIDAKNAWDVLDMKRVVVSNNHLDYKLVFDGEDGELLNEAARLLNEVKTSNRSQTSIDAFKDYINTKLMISGDDGNIKYSERALETFRAVYFHAFDQLTDRDVIDDELEKTVNTTYTCANGISDLDVQDKTTESLQSEYNTYIINKLDTRLQNGWNYVALNKDSINEKNDFSYIVKYVMKHMDLSKQFVLADYTETLKAMFPLENSNGGSGKTGTTTTTTTSTTGRGTASKVDDGQGGKINKEQLDKYGIDENDPEAKEKLEKAVQEDEEKKSIENATITTSPKGEIDEDGEVLSEQGKQTADDYSDGWNDAVKGRSKESGRSAAYNKGYSEGKEYRENKQEKYEDKDKTTETFEPVSGGSETTTETPVETQNYTEEVFVPIEETTEEVVDENIETQDFAPITTSKKLSSPKVTMNLDSTIQGEEIAPDAEAPAEIVEESDIEEEDYTYDPSEDIAELQSLKEELLTLDNDFEEFEPVEEYEEDNGMSL